MRHRLLPHPASQAAPVIAVEVEVCRDGGAGVFRYRIRGGAGAILLPAPAPPARSDELWRTTCFEAFIRPGADAAYVEFNFSPSTQWAAYGFTGYRQGMANADVAAPAIKAATDGGAFTLEARIDLQGLALTSSARLGLSAVLETSGGAKSYWALAHTRDKPDFHCADAFIARLPFESGA